MVVCMILASAISPSCIVWTNGHNAGGVVCVPAVWMFEELFRQGPRERWAGFVLGVFPIIIVSSVLFGLSLAFFKRKKV